MNIRYLRQEEIDKVKWNSCVHYATNGNIFGYKWFLDFIAKDWDALVEGDYESVFPLVWKQNWLGQKSLYQPHLMRELGLYSIHVLSQKRIQAFLNELPTYFKKLDIALNEQMLVEDSHPFRVFPILNQQLILRGSYDEIEDGYREELKKQLAAIQNLRLTTSLTPESVADFYKKHQPKSADQDKKYHAMLRVMYNALHRGLGNASGVMDEHDQLLAVNFFLYSHGKATSLLPAVSAEGKKRGALQFLFDIFIRGNATRPLILDFNSSSEWYSEFGAVSNRFFKLKL